jgi:predicted metal-dependent phosphoesterase TrpH
MGTAPVSARTTLHIDPHVHTRGSFDCDEPLERVLERAAKSVVDGLVVTDHDCVSNALAAADRGDEYGLLVLAGVEVSTADGHLLAVGVRSRPPDGHPLAETVEWVRDDGGVAVVPHPFQRTRHGVSADAVADCDGVEVFNAHALVGFRNRQAARFAARKGYPRFAGSDAHRAEDIGRAYTEVSVDARDPTAGDVLEAMRDGRTRAVGTRTSRRQYVRKLAGSAKRNSGRLFPI